MRRTRVFAAAVGGISMLVAGAAGAGAIGDQFRGGAFGLSWGASKAQVEARYPGGKWDADEKGRARYCAASRQSLLKLAAQYQTRELCFLMGSDGSLASATARMEPTLPALLAVVNRSRTMFGDFDAVRRDDNAIQSRSTAMLWMKDAPYVVQVASANDANNQPVDVTFTVSNDAGMHSGGAERVSHQPAGGR
jgi:hypothetical protein